MAKYTKEYAQDFPDDGPVYVPPQWDDATEPVETPEQIIARQIEEKRNRTAPTPIPAPAIPTPEASAPIIERQIDASTKASNSAERKKRWREKHGEEAKRKEREYLKAWRAKRKNQSQ